MGLQHFYELVDEINGEAKMSMVEMADERERRPKKCLDDGLMGERRPKKCLDD